MSKMKEQGDTVRRRMSKKGEMRMERSVVTSAQCRLQVGDSGCAGVVQVSLAVKSSRALHLSHAVMSTL